MSAKIGKHGKGFVEKICSSLNLVNNPFILKMTFWLRHFFSIKIAINSIVICVVSVIMKKNTGRQKGCVSI